VSGSALLSLETVDRRSSHPSGRLGRVKKHVLILGAGFGGLKLATRLSETMSDAVRVTLLDRNDSWYFGYSKLDVMLGRRSADEVRLCYSDVVKEAVEVRPEIVGARGPDPDERRNARATVDAEGPPGPERTPPPTTGPGSSVTALGEIEWRPPRSSRVARSRKPRSKPVVPDPCERCGTCRPGGAGRTGCMRLVSASLAGWRSTEKLSVPGAWILAAAP
jgi:hypothetical protein